MKKALEKSVFFWKIFAIFRHNRTMVLGFSIAFFVLVVAIGVYFVVLSPHADNMSTLVSGSYEAVRSSDLDVSKTFDVHMQDTRIGDVFSSFPEDSEDALTAQSIVEEVDRIRLDITNAQPKRRPMHFTLS